MTQSPDPKTQQNSPMQTHKDPDKALPPHPNSDRSESLGPEPACGLRSEQNGQISGRRDAAEAGEDEGVRLHHPNSKTHNTSTKPVSSRSGHRVPQGHPDPGVGPTHEPRMQQDNVVLRRGFVPRTTPERMAQRKSSMAQLQQWVNQRRVLVSQEDLSR